MPNLETLFLKWFGRLIRDEDWTLEIVADQFRKGCEVSTDSRHRLATIYCQTGLAPNEETACHEVCHILLDRLYSAVHRVTDCLDGNAHNVAVEWLDQASEEVCNMLARRFVEAYKEGKDG